MPELITVTLCPVIRRVFFSRYGLDLLGSSRIHPFFRQDLVISPFTFLQVEQPQFRHIFRLNAQPPSADVYSLRVHFPIGIFNAQRFKQAGLEVIDEFFTCRFLQDGRQHERSCRVIKENRSRLVLDRSGQKRFYPIVAKAHLLKFPGLSHGHFQQVVHIELREIRRDRVG
ncbi:hypothetical protein SDC9_128569 [bioreactor metagenome]|uniref:Uncharacterized protein n=1 Tax=bioreactor metagenome TaxID=1076179 RepID=A0A645CWK9_9ZZZZ